MPSLAAALVPTLEELAGQFDRLLAADRAAEAACIADPGDPALDAVADEACAAVSAVCAAIAQLPAQTAEHVRLKARALDWSAFSTGEPQPCNERLAYQLVRALLDGVPS